MYHSRSRREGDSSPEDSSDDDADVLFKAGSDTAPGRIFFLFHSLLHGCAVNNFTNLRIFGAHCTWPIHEGEIVNHGAH